MGKPDPISAPGVIYQPLTGLSGGIAGISSGNESRNWRSSSTFGFFLKRMDENVAIVSSISSEAQLQSLAECSNFCSSVDFVVSSQTQNGLDSHLGCLDAFGSDAPDRALFDETFNLDRRGLFDGAALKRLRDHCREHAIDVVHAHDAASEAMAALVPP